MQCNVIHFNVQHSARAYVHKQTNKQTQNKAMLIVYKHIVRSTYNTYIQLNNTIVGVHDIEIAPKKQSNFTKENKAES